MRVIKESLLNVENIPKPRKTVFVNLTVVGQSKDIDEFYKEIDKLQDYMQEKKMEFGLLVTTKKGKGKEKRK